jgi:hypothetical protein
VQALASQSKKAMLLLVHILVSQVIRVEMSYNFGGEPDTFGPKSMSNLAILAGAVFRRSREQAMSQCLQEEICLRTIRLLVAALIQEETFF